MDDQICFTILFSNIRSDVSLVNVVASTISSTSLQISWENTASADSYTVEYQLTIRDQCEEVSGNRTVFSTGPETSVTITGLEAYSTYDVFVSSAGSWPPCTTNSDSTTGVTDEGGTYNNLDNEFQISMELHE